MAARGLLQSDKLAVMDLALYPNSGAEKLFLQDLYAALHAPGEILVFEHYESCYPGFLKTLADLAVKGSAPLSSRYLVNKEGILVDAGRAGRRWPISSVRPSSRRWAMSVRPAPLRGKPSPRWQPSSSTRWPQK